MRFFSWNYEQWVVLVIMQVDQWLRLNSITPPLKMLLTERLHLISSDSTLWELKSLCIVPLWEQNSLCIPIMLQLGIWWLIKSHIYPSKKRVISIKCETWVFFVIHSLMPIILSLVPIVKWQMIRSIDSDIILKLSITHP